MLRYRLVYQFDAATWLSQAQTNIKVLTIRECSNRFYSAFDFLVDAFNGVACPDLFPVFSWIVHICERLFDAFLHFLGSDRQLHFAELLCYKSNFSRADFLLSWAWMAFSIIVTVRIFVLGVTVNTLR